MELDVAGKIVWPAAFINQLYWILFLQVFTVTLDSFFGGKHQRLERVVLILLIAMDNGHNYPVSNIF